MSLQFRRGLDADRAATTFASGEPVWTTDTHVLYVGDGITAGGIQVAGGGGGGNPFDQDLYTTSSVSFATIAANTATISKLYINNTIEGENYNININTIDGYGMNFHTIPEFQQGISVSPSYPAYIGQITANTNPTVIFNSTATFTQGIEFNDSTVQTTAFTGDLRIQGTWLRNVDTGDIYISPQDGYTGVYFPSDTYSVGESVVLFNTNTGTVQINSNQHIWTFDASGNLVFPDTTVQTTAYTGGGGGNPFDQTLDTTSTVTFNSINVTTSIDGVEGCVTNMTQFRSGWYAGGGYTFKSDTGYDSGMYSQGDGLINFMANNTNIIELTTSGAQFDQPIVLNGVNIVGGNYQANTLSLPVGGGATVTAGFEGGVTLRASNNNTDFSSWNFAQNGTITYNSYGNNLRLENTTGYGTTIDDISHVDVQVSVAPVNDGDPVYGAARISSGQAYLQTDTTTTSLILRLSSNGQVDTGAYDIVFNENNTFSSWNTNLRNQYGSINLQTNNPDLVGGRVFTSLNHYSNNNNSSFEIYIEAADGSGNKTWYFTQAGELQFPDNTVQTTAGGTSLYARNSLPAGAQGRIITITDSGSDTNSPAGNWAPAYWDDDAEAWTYVGNSNTVTII